jgi:hypothetical protein
MQAPSRTGLALVRRFDLPILFFYEFTDPKDEKKKKRRINGSSRSVTSQSFASPGFARHAEG